MPGWQVVVLAVAGVAAIRRARRQAGSRIPAASGEYPVVGHLRVLPYGKRGQLFHFYQEAIDHDEELGDESVGVIRYTVLGTSMYLISTPQAADLLLRKQGFLPKTRFAYDLFNLLGVDQDEWILAYKDGDEHRRLRQELNRFFNADNVAMVYNVLYDAVDAMVQRVTATTDKECDGSVACNIPELATTIINRVVMKVFFQRETEPPEEVIETFNAQVKHVGNHLLNPLAYKLIQLGLMPGAREIKRNYRCLRTYWAELVDEFYKRPLHEDNNAFWACIRRAYPDAMTNHKQYVRALGNLAAVYGAGSETTVNSISSILAAIALCPDTLRRLEVELDEAGLLVTDTRPSPRRMERDDFESLKWLDAVVHEGLRLFPPAPTGGLRVLTSDVDINGVKLKKGSQVQLSPWGMHYSRRTWGEDARQWRPERWLEGPSIHKVKRDGEGFMRFVPFVIGSQNCVAQHLAMMEIRLVVAAVVSNMHLALHERTSESLWTSVEDMTRNMRGYLTLNMALWLKLTPRSQDGRASSGSAAEAL